MRAFVVPLLLIGLLYPATSSAAPSYPWLAPAEQPQPLEKRLEAPPGFRRVEVKTGSFAEWLRFLPLKPAGTEVRLYDGRLKGRQDVHVAVIDIDVGKRDLQQCADAIMRLRAEYLFSVGRIADISFNATSGEPIPFSRWARGERASLSANRLKWVSGGKVEASHPALRTYLDLVFAYAGTHSLEKELVSVREDDVSIGDIFIQGGFPGHAVIVVDLAINDQGERRVLLAQSFMPAQDIHILMNLQAHDGSPWFMVQPGKNLITPEWTFPSGRLRRFQRTQ